MNNNEISIEKHFVESVYQPSRDFPLVSGTKKTWNAIINVKVVAKNQKVAAAPGKKVWQWNIQSNRKVGGKGILTDSIFNRHKKLSHEKG